VKFIWTATTAARHFGLTKRHFIRKILPLHILPSRIETKHHSFAELYIFGAREMKRIATYFRSL